MGQLGPGKQLRLLYRMTRDGETGKDFHYRCDNKGPTVSLFKTSTGRRFGGYTKEKWGEGSGKFKADSSAFLMSFDYQQRFNVQDSQDAIYCRIDCGPFFGGDNLGAVEPFNGNDKCASDASSTEYNIADSNGKSLLTAADGKRFTAVEIEVFEVL